MEGSLFLLIFFEVELQTVRTVMCACAVCQAGGQAGGFVHGEWICRCASCHAAVSHLSHFRPGDSWPRCAACGKEDTRGMLYTDTYRDWRGVLSRLALRGIRGLRATT